MFHKDTPKTCEKIINALINIQSRQVQNYSRFPLWSIFYFFGSILTEIKRSQMKAHKWWQTVVISLVNLLTQWHSHFFCGCTSSLVTSNISISLMIRSAIILLFAQTILRDIKSNGPPKMSKQSETHIRTLNSMLSDQLHAAWSHGEHIWMDTHRWHPSRFLLLLWQWPLQQRCPNSGSQSRRRPPPPL